MNYSELLKKEGTINLNDLVWQDSILTEDDKYIYQANGYQNILTKQEFEEHFTIPAENICYTPSIYNQVLYFNRKTLAISTFPMFHYLSGSKLPPSLNLDTVSNLIEQTELDVANGIYIKSIRALPDSVRIEYFNLLIKKIEKENTIVSDLYELFKQIYTSCDYGFSSLESQVFEKIIKAKSLQSKYETTKSVEFLPDIVTIYRGHTEGISTPEDKTYSWTTDISVANFFAIKLGNEKSEIITATVPKNKIIEYLDDRDESEVWINYSDIDITDRLELYGLDFIKKVLPVVEKDYIHYKTKLEWIEFDYVSTIHGKLHTLRVLLHILFISHMLNLPHDEKEILCTAALWHDTGRSCDGIDDEHGFNSMLNYEGSFEDEINPIVSFIIQYHSIDDNIATKKLESYPCSVTEKETIIKLYNIFKDADALDRIRLGFRDLDINYLRLSESKHLTKVARIFYDQIKL